MALKKADQGVLDRFAIEVASGAALGLQDVIGDILDIVRIESGKLSLAPERANLKQVIESLVRVFDGLARQKHLHLVIDLDQRANCDVSIDPLRFKQVISNLLSNAIKFTTEGKIGLRLEVLPGVDETELHIRLRVQDSGIGISAEDQRHLFSPFSQASNNQQSGRAGSGLGLVISRTLCEMMGGTLTLSSELGTGTEIEMLLGLPILEPLEQPAAPRAEEVLQQRVLTILVVDDYPPNRLLLSKQLSYLGHNVVEAEDGAQGLRVWQSRHFDVVITDCNMPVMNGYDFARAVRAEELKRDESHCLILGFTANAQPDETSRCLNAGMDDCLFKPISLKALEERLASATATVPPVAITQGAEGFAGGFSVGHLELLVDGDVAAMNDLLNDLARSNEDDLARLPGIFFAEDIQGLLDLAHKVKGGARFIHAQGLIAACEALESACSSALDEEALELAVAHINAEMLGLATGLKAYRRIS